MARCRNLKPTFFKNEDLADLPAEARLLFAGLWCWADRAGRLEDRPRRLKAEILPYSEVDVDDLLDKLAAFPGRFIVRYEVDGSPYIDIPGFATHQNPHQAEKASEIPAPPLHDACMGQAPCKNGATTDTAPDKHSSCRALTLNPQPLTRNPQEEKSAEADDLAELRAWGLWWNAMFDRGLVGARVRADEPSKAITRAWRRSRSDPETRELLADRPAIEAAIAASEFITAAGWFRLEKLFGGRNADGELIVRKLLENGYKDDKRNGKAGSTPGPGQRFDPPLGDSQNSSF